MSALAGVNVPTGRLIGRGLLDQLKAMHYDIIRLDLQGHDGQILPQGLPLDETRALAQEILDAGLQPLAIVRVAEQIHVLPEGSLAELGNEPDLKHFGWTPQSYRKEAQRAIDAALEHNTKLYLGAVSNLNKRGLAFLEQLDWQSYPSSNVAVSVHRYPNGDNPQVPHSGFKSRVKEIERLREIVGARPMAVTEVGYHDGPQGWSEEQVAEHLAWERRFFSAEGFELVCVYNINDGTHADTESHYGIRRIDNTWKPSATAFTA